MSDITREDAIKILKDTLYDERTPNNYIQAVRMGREALENQKSLQAELEEIKAEMQDYGCSFIIAKRIDLASAVSNCIRMVDKHIKKLEKI